MSRQYVEELPVIVSGLQLLAVDRHDEAARRNLHVLLVGRTLALHLIDFVVAGSRVRRHAEAGVARLHALRRDFTRKQSAARNAGVGGVQLADHFHDQVMQLFGVGHVFQHRLVFVLRRRPVYAVHFGIVEAILHHAPGFFENLLALSLPVNHHADREVDALGRRSTSNGCRCCQRRGGTTGAPSATSRSPGRTVTRVGTPSRHGDRIKMPGDHRVHAAAIARPLRFISPAEPASAATRSATAATAGRRFCSHCRIEPLHARAIVFDDVDRRTAA